MSKKTRNSRRNFQLPLGAGKFESNVSPSESARRYLKSDLCREDIAAMGKLRDVIGLSLITLETPSPLERICAAVESALEKRLRDTSFAGGCDMKAIEREEMKNAILAEIERQRSIKQPSDKDIEEATLRLVDERWQAE